MAMLAPMSPRDRRALIDKAAGILQMEAQGVIPGFLSDSVADRLAEAVLVGIGLVKES